MNTHFLTKALLTMGGLAVLAAPQASYASLQFCNRTNSQLSLAVGYIANSVWTSGGWWNVTPGSCVTPISGNLTNRYYYYHAHSSGGGSWDGDYTFCTTNSAFTISGDENCSGRGYETTGFRQIDTEGRRDMTMNLTSSGESPPIDRDDTREVTRTNTRTYGGVRDCGRSGRQQQEAIAACSAVQANLRASGYTIVYRFDPEIIDSSSNVDRFCTDPLPFGGCVGYGNRCQGRVEVRCRFQVR